MKTVQKIAAWAASLLSLIMLFTSQALAQQKTELSDAEVASVAVVANQIDIDNAKIAQERSKDDDVLKFAETMISDHKAVIAQAAALVKKLGVTPKDNAVSQQLQTDADKAGSMLRSKSGAAFDKAYIDHEVEYHKAVIDAVENLLIPETDNTELKELLQNVVPALQAHLEHAQMLQKQLVEK